MAVSENKENKFDWGKLLSGVQEKKSGKIPRIENQRLLLTYKNHLNKEMLKGMLTDLNKRDCDRIEIAHEIGTKGNVDYPHTHVAVDFGRRYINKKSDCMSAFDVKDESGGTVEWIHPHIRIITSVKHWKNVMQYLAKEDPDNEHLLAEFGDPSAGLRAMFEDIRDGDGDICDNLIKYASTMQEIVPVIQACGVLSKKSMTGAQTVRLSQSTYDREIGIDPSWN